MNKVLGIINLHNDPVLKSLHKDRIMANTPLLGRYYTIDFALSNFANSNINSIEILIKEKPTLLFKHLNLGAKEWAVNTKTGGITLMYNDKPNNNLSSDLENLNEHIDFIENKNIDHVIIVPTFVISNIDYKDIYKSHLDSGRQLTLVYTKNIKSNNLDSFENQEETILMNKDGLNKLLDIYIINKETFISLLKQNKKENMFNSLKELVYSQATKEKPNLFELNQFVGLIEDLNTYHNLNLDVLNLKNLKSLFTKNRPVYTRSYDNIPTKYGENSKVTNSLIANEVLVDGEVHNSIISRGATIEEGAIVKNSIIFSRAIIKKGALLKNVIVEKNKIIKENRQMKSEKNKPKYVK